MKAELDRLTPKHLMGASAGIRSFAILRLTSQFGPVGIAIGDEIHTFGSEKGYLFLANVAAQLGPRGLVSANYEIEVLRSSVPCIGADCLCPMTRGRNRLRRHVPFSYAASRSDTRAKESGREDGGAIRVDAISEAGEGRLGPPQPLISSGGPLFLGGRVSAAFSFAVTQMDKMWAATTSNTDASI